MSGIMEVFLGIVSAMGGFVDLGELVFTSQAGAVFAYTLIWAVVLGTIGIIVFGEMSGRVAAVSKQATFTLVRQRLGVRLGLVALLASVLLTLLTCAAEIGGLAIAMRLLLHIPYYAGLLTAYALVMLLVWLLPFKWIEQGLGSLGMFMLVVLVAAFFLRPDWHAAAAGLVPSIPHFADPHMYLLYAYFVVAILSAVWMPYEVYFYSSGGIEDEWKPKDLGINAVTSILGFSLGSLLALALLIDGAALFHPLGVTPQLLGTSALDAAVPFGKWGLVLALVGFFFAILGAALETGLSGAYSVAQFFGFQWGKHLGHRRTPVFTLVWAAIFTLAFLVVLTGVDPVSLVEYAVVLSVLALPFSYFPILMEARDRKSMGEHANGRVANALAWAFLVLIVLVALSAVPLLILTNGGKG